MPEVVTLFQKLMLALVLGLVGAVSESDVNAQTNHDLSAPAQSPDFRIATVEVGDDGQFVVALGRTVVDSRPTGGPAAVDIEVIEIVTESEFAKVNEAGMASMRDTYAVQVPYTEMVQTKNGSEVRLRTRKELRTRTVPVSNAKDKKIVEYQENIPARIDGASGDVTDSRTATHKLAIPKDHELIRKKVVTPLSFPKADVKFFDLQGNPIGTKQAIVLIGDKAPLILLDKADQKLDPFYAEILKPNTLFAFIEDKTFSKVLSEAKK